MHFSHCRMLGCWAETIFSPILLLPCRPFHLPIPMGAVSIVSRVLKPTFGPTDIAEPLRHLLNLALAALKLLLVHSSSAFTSTLCLALKLTALHSKVVTLCAFVDV